MKNLLGALVMLSRTNGRMVQIPVVAAIILAGIVTTEYVVLQAEQRAIQQQRTHTVVHLATLRARLEGEVNSTLHLARGLVGYAATHPDLDWSEFELMAAEIVSTGKHVRNIGLAPGNVLRFVYPRSGNERAIGLKYAEIPKQWPAVKRAIDLGSTIVAGPVNLVQGGKAFISRTPIFSYDRTRVPTAPPEYWGLASVVIEMPSLFAAAGILSDWGNLRIAMRGKDGLGADGGMIFGPASLFDDDVVVQDVMIPNGKWQIGAIPRGGWQAPTGETVTIWMAGYGATFVFAALLFLLLGAYRRNREMALRDPLTGLSNRRLLVERLEQLIALHERGSGGFSVLYVDLNGFKPVNDRYGHAAGDLVLQEIAERLGTCTRRTDTVARVGGDEFVVVVAGATGEATVQDIVDKVHDTVQMPVHVRGSDLTVTASVGTATYPGDAETVERLLARADQAMYAAKSARVVRMVSAAP